MRNRDIPLYQELSNSLNLFEAEKQLLEGIVSQENRHAFLLQIIDSIRRVKYYQYIQSRTMSASQASFREDFDPLKAAVYHSQSGNLDEAFWLIFLATHFGKNGRTAWKLIRDVYWALGEGYCWSWQRVSQNPNYFTDWLRSNYDNLKNDGVARNFGNHRKYETLRPTSARSTWRVVNSYISWIGQTRSHQAFLEVFYNSVGNDSKQLFQAMYNSMSSVLSFARTGKFDFLTTLSNLNIVPITADSTYLKGATGPLRGAKLLFGGSVLCNLRAGELEVMNNSLDEYLGVGMQVLEDSMCNWQKSPSHFIAFRG
ncbi:MAG: hypothetical protein PSV17_09875 [Methylotenera sp.]|uniref:alpha-glutamyl/putrescinyl thymine pyrophosphorylase clade 3 protein n=1 Tax=Methylotenera sp. TaxID=2051956 RepID=UPI0024880305|nr:hypothetical protein [Methylotenera sp.]MDI1309725.1 hypothetical protein [Methylotenera sp.]